MHRPAHRRSRVPLSCDPCRTRKLKCNREKPCQNCIARDERTACRFRGSVQGPASAGTGESMQQRMNHLEGLVERLIAERQEQRPPQAGGSAPLQSQSGAGLPMSAGALEAPVPRPGATVIDGDRSVYSGADDWYDVLQEIKDLKSTWSQTQDGQSDPDIHPRQSHMVDGSSLLFGQVKPIERIEILTTLPPKSEVDVLISRFFDRANFPITIPPIIHKPTFMREYNAHWKDPAQTNFIWLGLLFSILGITMLSHHQFGEPPECEGTSESLFQLYRIRTAQCLLAGDIAKCLPYTVETLRFNATAELNRKDDNRRGLWIMTGVIVRAAINMGYHRDPGQSSSISVLQAEYRRRIWLSVISMDDMTSFMGGFPRTLSAVSTDTLEPRNLHDYDLSEDTTVLPASRPLAEVTPVTYLIVKGRLSRALGRIADFNSTPHLGSYDTVLEIDTALYDAYRDFPEHMKINGGNSARPGATPGSYISNLRLVCLYYQGMCTLHRRFMARGRIDNQFKLSRDRCLSSALALLNHQQLLEASWYIFSQTRHMLTFAAMVILLELELRRRSPDAGESPSDDTLLQALETSCALWKEVQYSSDEVSRVYQTLSGMISTLGGSTESDSARLVTPESPFGLPDFSLQIPTFDTGLSFEKDLSAMDIDWGIWDTFIEGASFQDGPVY